MKKILTTGTALLFILFSQGCMHEELLPDIEFSILHESSNTDNGTFTNKGTKVLSNQNDYKTELLKYTSDEAVSIDFSKSNVLLVDMGQQSSGGFSIGVYSVKEDESSVTVTVVLTEPGKNCPVTRVLTNPYQFVEISSKKKILINEKLIPEKECAPDEPKTPDTEPLPSNFEFSVLHSSNNISNGTFTNKGTKILSNQNDYKTELLKYSSDAVVSIDFSKSNVLLVDMGQQSSSGFSINVSSVKQESDSVITTVISTQPGKNCPVDDALTNPYQFIEIPSKKKILIKEESVSEEECLQNAVDTWGQYLNPQNIIPTDRFMAFYINTNTPEEVIASQTVDTISVNYAWDDFHGIKSEDFGAYWVGNYTFAEDTEMQINISQSWSKARVIIDGLVVYEGENNAEVPFHFTQGTHKIEVEYINNWHTTSFSMVIMPPQKKYKRDELKEALELSDDYNVWYVGIYESEQQNHSVDVVLSKSDKPVVLLLQSYETTRWNIKNPFGNNIEAIITGRSQPGTQVLGDVEEQSVFYAGFRLGSYKLYPECDCHASLFHCENENEGVINTNKEIGSFLNKEISGFNGVYSAKNMDVPEIILNAEKYEEIDEEINNIEIERQACANPDFNDLFQ